MTEAQHQTNIIKWSQQPHIRAKYPELALLYHVPNEGKRDARTGKILKQTGMKVGVPDLCLPVARGPYHGLYIELKTYVGKPSHEQQWWIKRLNEQDYYAVIAYGWDKAVEILQAYLEGRIGDTQCTQARLEE